MEVERAYQPLIDSGTVFAGRAEADKHVPKMQAITKVIFESFEKTYLDCPA